MSNAIQSDLLAEITTFGLRLFVIVPFHIIESNSALYDCDTEKYFLVVVTQL